MSIKTNTKEVAVTGTLVENTMPALVRSEKERRIELSILAGSENLDVYDKDELVEMFRNVGKRTVIARGQILNAIRAKWPVDVRGGGHKYDRAFGDYLKSKGLNECSQQARNRWMHLARHFVNKNTVGMSVSVCTEIALLMSSDRQKGNKAYDYAMHRGLTIDQIKLYIWELKGDLSKPKPKVKDKIKNKEYVPVPEPEMATVTPQTTQWDNIPVVNLKPEERVWEFLKEQPLETRIQILQACLAKCHEAYITP